MLLNSFHKFPKFNIYSLRRISINNNDNISEEKVGELKNREFIRNKSRLKSHHRNMVHNIFNEYDYSPKGFYLKNNQKLFARYGSNSFFDESKCWPNREQIRKSINDEKIFNPLSLQEMKQKADEYRIKNEEFRKTRQQEILIKMEKLEGWTNDLKTRIAKKAEAAEVTRARKERLIEEVRREIGYQISMKDERFKELLEKKDKAEKKQTKEEKKKLKAQKLLNKVTEIVKSKEIKD